MKQGEGKVSLLNNEEMLVEYDGLSTRFFLGKAETLPNEAVDTIIINVWDLDTTQYNKMFSFWQRVQITGGTSYPPYIDNLNHNGNLEIYGTYLNNYSLLGPVRIFEMDINKNYNLLTP